MANIFITGGTGFTGANLVYLHSLLGNNITILGRKEKAPFNTSFFALNRDFLNKINIVNGDIKNENLILKTLVDYQIDYVYHLCGQTIVSRATESPRDFYETNMLGTLSLLEAERRLNNKIPTLVVSTDKVYGDVEQEFYVEEMPYKPKSIYDSSKVMEDLLALSYANVYGLPIAVSRASNIYGSGDFNPRIIPNTIFDCLNGRDPVVYEGINSKRDYIYSFDVCRAYDAIIKNIKKTKGNAFNVGTGVGLTQEEVVTEIIKYFPERNIKYVKPKDYMLKEIGNQVSSSEKLNKITKWKPLISFKVGIEETVEWYKNYVK